MNTKTVPFLVTFDGEARSGKGTIVQTTKDYLRDERGYKVMLIDRGQTFRVLAVVAKRDKIDLDNAKALDEYLEDEVNIAAHVKLVKEVYRMEKSKRDSLLYTNEVGENSAKIGARPYSHVFVKMLTKKWLHDAGEEGYGVVLVDGRTLEEIAYEMQNEGICQYRLGLYFICNPVVGARRTLGYADKSYEELTEIERKDVNEFVEQILERNRRDKERTTERLKPPAGAETCILPNLPAAIKPEGVPMLIIDTSAELTKNEMSLPVAEFVAESLKS